MATTLRAELRADNFCAQNRALPELEFMYQQLKQYVADDVLKRVEKQLSDKGLERKERQWWVAMLRFLSRVSDDKVWDEAVADCILNTFHRQKIERVQPVRAGGPK